MKFFCLLPGDKVTTRDAYHNEHLKTAKICFEKYLWLVKSNWKKCWKFMNLTTKRPKIMWRPKFICQFYNSQLTLMDIQSRKKFISTENIYINRNLFVINWSCFWLTDLVAWCNTSFLYELPVFCIAFTITRYLHLSGQSVV